MSRKSPSEIRGLYAITPDELNTDRLQQQVEQALLGGVTVLQYRNKLADPELARQQASMLRQLANSFSVPLIINDSVALAIEVEADGVHLGGDDGSVAAARAQLGPNKIIGASCYNQLILAHRAQQDGASYVAFGSCFASPTKPHAPVAGLPVLLQARDELSVPIVAIGGITLSNASILLDAGVSAIAVISTLFAASNIRETAKQFSQLPFPA